jgi:hypothetical protein
VYPAEEAGTCLRVDVASKATPFEKALTIVGLKEETG